VLDSAARDVWLYARFSNDDKTKADSIDHQVRAMRMWAEALNKNVLGVFQDNGVSGKDFPRLSDRPDGRLLMDAARQGGGGQAVVIYRFDRLSRAQVGVLGIVDDLQKLGVGVISIHENFDTTTPMGRFMLGVLAGFSELEVSMIREKMASGRDSKASKGQRVTGMLPFGYDVDDDKRLVLSDRTCADMAEWEIAREVFRRVADGASCVETARWLDMLGVPTESRYRNGTTLRRTERWSDQRLCAMLKMPVYRGVDVLKVSPPITTAVPAIVDDATWHRANKQLGLNKKRGNGRETRPYLLKGLIKCMNHDEPRTYVGFYGGNGKVRHHRYQCGAMGDMSSAGKCGGRTFKADDIEADVWEECVAILRHPEEAMAELRKLTREKLASSAASPAIEKELRERLAERIQARERVEWMFAEDKINMLRFDEMVVSIDRDVIQTRGELEMLGRELERAAAYEQHMTTVANVLERLKRFIGPDPATTPAEHRRIIIDGLVEDVKVWTEAVGPTHPGRTGRPYRAVGHYLTPVPRNDVVLLGSSETVWVEPVFLERAIGRR
jgi:site-specific DNA recombinase